MANERPTNSKLDELFANRPSGGTASERLPIGVDDDYRVSGPRRPTHQWSTVGKGIERDIKIPPRYFEGDEMRPLRNSWTPTQIADLQRKMQEAGLLKGKFRLGYWDAPSQQAYTVLLTYANQSGRDAGGALNDLRTRPINAGEDEERPPLVIRTTSPDDLRGVFRDTSRKLLGRHLSPQELDQYIAAYNQIETQKQQEAYNLDPTGGRMVDAPTKDSFVEERIKREKPDEFMAHEEVSQYEQFLQLLGAD